MENEKTINTSKFLSGDKVEVTDQYGSYHRAPGVVFGFSTNQFKRLLVNVRLDAYSGSTTCFYPHELTLLERPESPVPDNYK